MYDEVRGNIINKLQHHLLVFEGQSFQLSLEVLLAVVVEADLYVIFHYLVSRNRRFLPIELAHFLYEFVFFQCLQFYLIILLCANV